jgi:hypothetical protein
MAGFATAQDYRRIRGALRHVTDRPVGSHFFVNSAHASAGTSSGHGYSPDSPLTTIDAAVALCTANAGDTIYVGPGHVETVAAAAGLDLDVAGISVIGIGNGSLQPKVDLTTATTADVDIDAANITIENIQFEASFADVAAAVDVNADDCTIRNCRFLSPTANENAKIWILGATAAGSDRLTVEDCYFQDADAANTHAISLADGTADGVIIRRNIMHGFYETGGIGGTGALTNITILENYILNADTDADSCIALSGSPTGIVARNIVGAALAGDVTTNIAVGAACLLAENYSVDIGDRQGVLDPAAT